MRRLGFFGVDGVTISWSQEVEARARGGAPKRKAFCLGGGDDGAGSGDRSRASHLLDGRIKELVRRYLETVKQELGQLTEPYGAANGDAHKEATTMWSKLFGGGDELPRDKVDAVVRIIDRYLAEEAELGRLQSEKQTIHPRDLPPDKRRALIEEVFARIANTRKK